MLLSDCTVWYTPSFTKGYTEHSEWCRETDPNWDLDIGNDVKEEGEKFGPVMHHYVDKNSKVRFECMLLMLLLLVVSVASTSHAWSSKHLIRLPACFVVTPCCNVVILVHAEAPQCPV